MKRSDILLLGEVVIWIGIQIVRAGRINLIEFDTALAGRVTDDFRERFNARDRNSEAL